jgi:hypothetical protein
MLIITKQNLLQPDDCIFGRFPTFKICACDIIHLLLIFINKFIFTVPFGRVNQQGEI